MNIRQAVESDIPEIIVMMKNLFLTWDKIDEMDKIDKEWFSSQKSYILILKRIKSKNSNYFVAEFNNQIAGYIFCTIEFRDFAIDKEIGLIDELYVKPDYRKSGTGKLLTNTAIDWFKQNNIKWSILLTHHEDKDANNYWNHTGYQTYNIKYRKKIK